MDRMYAKLCDLDKLNVELQDHGLILHPAVGYNFYGTTTWGDSTIIHFTDEVESAPLIAAADVVEEHVNAPLTRLDLITIQSWASHGQLLGADYKYTRLSMIYIAAVTGFDNLSLAEQKLAAEWFAVVKADRDKVYTVSEQIAFGKTYHDNSCECRKNRAHLAEVEIYNRLSLEDAYATMMDCGELISKYIDYGLEGLESQDPTPGLYDFLQATTGTAYETTGLAVRGYTPYGCTLAELVTTAVNFLKYGP